MVCSAEIPENRLRAPLWVHILYIDYSWCFHILFSASGIKLSPYPDVPVHYVCEGVWSLFNFHVVFKTSFVGIRALFRVFVFGCFRVPVRSLCNIVGGVFVIRDGYLDWCGLSFLLLPLIPVVFCHTFSGCS